MTIALSNSGCTHYLYFNEHRFKDLKKVGVIIGIQTIKVFMRESNGVYVYKYPPTGYEEPLDFVEKNINPKNEIKKFYKELLKEKGISIKELDYKLQYYNPPIKYYKQPPPYPKERNEPSFPFDLKDLVNHFSEDDEIDAILIVDVQYGLMIDRYFRFIDVVNGTQCEIYSIMVDLNDKNIIYDRGPSNTKKNIKGKWNTPPTYENLTNSFKSAISDAIAKERTKAHWQLKNKP